MGARRETRLRGSSVPWWAHQAVEYGLGLLVVVQAVHTQSRSASVGGIGAAIALFAAVTAGPLGVINCLGPRAHRALDFVAAAVLVCSPVLLHLTDLLGVALIEGAALTILWLALHTTMPPARSRQTARPPVQASPPSSSPAYDIGRMLRSVGTNGPRTLGRVVGRLRTNHRRSFLKPPGWIPPRVPRR